MAHANIEIELKFPLHNPDIVRAFLAKEAKVQAEDVSQKDTYYIPSHRDFLAPKYPYEWLRLRQTTKGTSLNYKHFYPENTEITDYCDEYETRVDHHEAIEKIFTSLDLRPAIVVDKVRSTWLYKDVEIALDHVQGLGWFIELEATTGFATPQEAKGYLRSILSELDADIGPEDLRGYPYLLIQKSQ